MSDQDKHNSDGVGENKDHHDSDDNKRHRRNSDDHKENPDHHHHRHHHHHHGRHSSNDKGEPEENRASFESNNDRKESNGPREEELPGPSSPPKADQKRTDPGKHDERNLSKEKDERKVPKEKDERKLSKEKDERKVSEEEDERKLSKGKDERKVSKEEDERKLSKEKDKRKVSNDSGDEVKKQAAPKMLLYEAHNKLRKHYHHHHPHDPAKEPKKEIKLPKLRSSKFWEQSSKSRQKVQSQHDLHRIKKRKTRLEKLLHLLDSMDKPPPDPQMLTALKYYGIPDQHKLLACLYDKEAIPASFGDNMRMYLSHVLRTRCCYNFYNCYNLLPKLRPTIQAIRFKGVQPHPQEFVNTERAKAAHRRTALHSIQSIALDEDHAAHLKELTIHQLTSLPITVMHEILNAKIKVVEQMCYKYSDLAGSSSTTAKIAMSHYNLMKKHLEAFEFIGLQSLPPLCVYRKFEEGPQEENPFITSSSSSEDEDELETFIHRDVAPTAEELAEQAIEEEDNRILQMAVEMNAGKIQ